MIALGVGGVLAEPGSLADAFGQYFVDSVDQIVLFVSCPG
jgi:hypothetical protein